MPARLQRLTRRADFQRLTRQASKRVMPGLILQAMPTPEAERSEGIRLGFTASRRVGGAVARNRAKRRLRAAADHVLANQAAGYDIVVIGRHATNTRPFALLIDDLQRAGIELGVVRGSEA